MPTLSLVFVSHFEIVFHNAKQLEAASLTLVSLLFYKIRLETGVLIIALSSLANSIMR